MPQGIGYDPATLAAIGIVPQMGPPMAPPPGPVASPINPMLAALFEQQMMPQPAQQAAPVQGFTMTQAPSATSTRRAQQSGPSATANRMDPGQYNWQQFSDQQLLQASGLGNLGMRNAAAAEAQRRGTMLKNIQMQQAKMR